MLVDGATVIDEWFDQSATSYTRESRLATGDHQMEIDYYNNLYEGRAHVGIELIEANTPTPTATPSETPSSTATVSAATPNPAPTSTVIPATTEASSSHERAPTWAATGTVTPTGTPLSTQTPTSGSSQPPRIECKWELPDMDSYAPGIQYIPAAESAAIAAAADAGAGVVPSGRASSHTYDDDAAVRPDRHHDHGDGGEPPCDIVDDDRPDQPDGVQHSIQVVPNLGDEPEQRRIELWLAATHPDGLDAIGSAFWVVYRPDGWQLAVVPGSRVAARDCDGVDHDDRAPGSMFDAAINTGQMSNRAADDSREGLHGGCHFGNAALYRGEFRLSVNEPCGEYHVAALVVSTGGTVAQLTNYIDVLCVFALKVDFRSVNWGELTPGQRDVVMGDARFRPGGDAAPTVKNVGNDGMGLRLRFSPLRTASGSHVDEFGSCFGRADDALECIDPIAAGVTASFDRDQARVLCSDETARLDLGVHPGAGLAPGLYRGVLSLVGVHVPGECTGDRHLH